MTTSTTQLTTRLRTWALIAGLTGLLIAVGALIGGLVLWLFVAGAVAMNLIGYFYSDRLTLRAARAHPLTRQQTPYLFAIAGDLAHRAQIPIPRLYVMPGEQPNAFATGRDQHHAAVAMTTDMLKDLETEQVRRVLATSSRTSKTTTSSSPPSPQWSPARSRPSRASCNSHSCSAATTRTAHWAPSQP